MRLINTSTIKIHEFPGDSVEDYAILSHTWVEDECTLQDMSMTDVELREGYTKIKFCCQQAVLDGLSWAWVDTCCIDKTSTAELSEAINSMFRWYSNAKVCYAYLVDVTEKDGLASSRWFSRGWTLQELIAPKVIRFYSMDWKLLGSKSELRDTLEKITGIEAFVLSTRNFHQVCVAKRMSWAAKRNTTRVEDEAYSLMGIFDVNMPLIYGEGKKAFLRLQQEILRVSDDQSLFAWGAPQVFPDMHNFLMSRLPNTHGLFADSPANFLTNHEILRASSREDSPPPVIHGNGVRVEYPVCKRGIHEFIIIACTTRGTSRAYIGIPVENWSGSFYASATFDTKRKSMNGIFPIHCFAAILGTSKYPWTIFVPILRDAHESTDFHEILRQSTAMATHCMTKSQLKERISEGDMTAFPPRARRFDQLLSVWRTSPSECRNLEVSVDLDIEQINLVDEAIFVSIDVHEVSVGHESSKLAFVHSKDVVNNEEATNDREEYCPNWLTIDQLEWFIDRVPWNHSS
ncbi:hypothetical protein GQX73_g7469 [Xylaria multiplex]|uniref:Uncharacterized protein n=1 Tax=Xylaria multiplex TaxID=323545 RepID=A0A7C8N1N3_9PEZI|nr:hypothetical protein GQX73_g7469 [Xylaria multiplex]